MILYINYDYTTGNEKSYKETRETLEKIDWGILKGVTSIETHCLSFFQFGDIYYTYADVEDIIVRCQNGDYISVKDLAENKGQGYCYNEIRPAHNIEKLLRAGLFDFKTKGDR